jgi:recombination protein RecT
MPPAPKNVRAAVAARDAEPSATELLRRSLEQWRPVIENLLPSHITVERFVATVGNACRTVPDLLGCEQATVVGAALKAAQLGLEPNDNRNLCWILPYRVKGGRPQAQWQLGYGGVIELCRRAAPGAHFDGRAVYPNDAFSVDYGRPRQPLTHRPAVSFGRPRGGDAYAWYVLISWADGQQTCHVLDREAVEYHRGFSKQPDGLMWTRSYDAAALKSVVLDMRRWLPQSPELASALDADGRIAVPDVEQIVMEELPASSSSAMIGPDPFSTAGDTDQDPAGAITDASAPDQPAGSPPRET